MNVEPRTPDHDETDDDSPAYLPGERDWYRNELHRPDAALTAIRAVVTAGDGR
ncbi:MAG TPA: hypothetical protein VK923_06470 [Euzebyales bacterium]|nr:hypothetical protein [Euzebyales bacterium]